MKEILGRHLRATSPSRLLDFIVKHAVALVFIAANVYSYYRMPAESSMADGFVSFGWPFELYLEGGFVGTQTIIWTGLIGNIAVALCVIWILLKLVKKWPNIGVKIHTWLSELF